MAYPVVHFEINTASQSDLARVYEEAFGWTTHADGDDYLQINTHGVCAGTGDRRRLRTRSVSPKGPRAR
jgi:predicted enzyme related to lactoylglutathione lyase